MDACPQDRTRVQFRDATRCPRSQPFLQKAVDGNSEGIGAFLAGQGRDSAARKAGFQRSRAVLREAWKGK